MELSELAGYLDDYLGLPEHPDYSGAHNGLQLEGRAGVTRVAAAVDASFATIEAAVHSRADLLLVHHGLFWDGAAPLTGRIYRKVKRAVEAGLAIYSAHLPLDSHPEVGNCAVLARALSIEVRGRFGYFEQVPIGIWGRLDEQRDTFVERLSGIVEGPVHLIPGGPERMSRVGVLTGGGGSKIRDAVEAGLDTFITGEGSHHTHFDAIELGINVFYAGHYATETWGVRALAMHLEGRFGLPWEFLDFPTGL